MSNQKFIMLTEAQVADLVTLDDTIDALEHGLLLEGVGRASNVPKALGTWGDGSSMHALGSMFPNDGYVGFKTWANTKRGATAMFNLFDADNGSLKAVMEAAVLGQLRTSAISGVATKWLARPDADEMALIGAGKQALTQVAAVNAVRPLRHVSVFSPTPESRRAFVDRAREVFDFPVDEAGSVEECVAGSPIVTLITRAVKPFLTADMLAPGAHLNAVGAILPKNAEFAQDVFERADIIAVDHLPNVQLASREFIDYFENGPGDWERVRSLGDILADGNKGRPTQTDITLFKAMGMGISDLSVAVMAYERARDRSVGLALAQPTRVAPRWVGMVAE